MEEKMKAEKAQINEAKKVSLIPTADPDLFIANKKWDVIIKSQSEYSCTCTNFKNQDNKDFPCKHIIAAAFEKKFEVEEDEEIFNKLIKKYNRHEIEEELQKEIFNL